MPSFQALFNCSGETCFNNSSNLGEKFPGYCGSGEFASLEGSSHSGKGFVEGSLPCEELGRLLIVTDRQED